MIWDKSARQKNIFDMVRINDRIRLTFRGNHYLSRVEDMEAGNLHAAAPISGGATLSARPGESVDVNVFLDSAMWRFSSVVKCFVDGHVPYLALSDFKDMGKVQRRNYVRVADKLQVSFRIDTGAASDELWRQAFTSDISGGGVRINCDGPAHVCEGSFIEVMTSVPGADPVHAIARVIRVSPNLGFDGGGDRMAVEFVEIHPSEQRKLVKYVLWKQAEVARSHRAAA